MYGRVHTCNFQSLEDPGRRISKETQAMGHDIYIYMVRVIMHDATLAAVPVTNLDPIPFNPILKPSACARPKHRHQYTPNNTTAYPTCPTANGRGPSPPSMCATRAAYTVNPHVSTHLANAAADSAPARSLYSSFCCARAKQGSDTSSRSVARV